MWLVRVLIVIIGIHILLPSGGVLAEERVEGREREGSSIGELEINDPFEGLNRKLLGFNFYLDTIAFKPLSYIYKEYVPRFIKDRLTSMGGPFDMYISAINYALVLDLHNAFIMGGKFISNITFGFFGALELASSEEEEERDFNDTLYQYNVNKGAYVVFPILGGLVTREFIGYVAGHAVMPWIIYDSVYVFKLVSWRASNYDMVGVRKKDKRVYELLRGVVNARVLSAEAKVRGEDRMEQFLFDINIDEEELDEEDLDEEELDEEELDEEDLDEEDLDEEDLDEEELDEEDK